MKPVKIVIPFTLPGLNDYIAAERVHRGNEVEPSDGTEILWENRL